MGKLCKQTVESESKVMRISLVRWPPGWLLCSLAAHPNTRVLSAFTCFWLGVTAPFVAFKKHEAKHAEDLFFFFSFFISSRLQLLSKDETLEFLINEIFHEQPFQKLLLCKEAFYRPVNISHQRAERLLLIELKHMLLKGLEEWIAHQSFCNLRAIFT